MFQKWKSTENCIKQWTDESIKLIRIRIQICQIGFEYTRQITEINSNPLVLESQFEHFCTNVWQTEFLPNVFYCWWQTCFGLNEYSVKYTPENAQVNMQLKK